MELSKLGIQIPASVHSALKHRAVDERKPVRDIVLEALEAYGFEMPEGAIGDRRGQRGREKC